MRKAGALVYAARLSLDALWGDAGQIGVSERIAAATSGVLSMRWSAEPQAERLLYRHAVVRSIRDLWFVRFLSDRVEVHHDPAFFVTDRLEHLCGWADLDPGMVRRLVSDLRLIPQSLERRIQAGETEASELYSAEALEGYRTEVLLCPGPLREFVALPDAHARSLAQSMGNDGRPGVDRARPGGVTTARGESFESKS